MKITVNNCNCTDLCDCKSLPANLCSIKQVVVECLKVKEVSPQSEARYNLQMGKIILADEILKIFDVKISE